MLGSSIDVTIDVSSKEEREKNANLKVYFLVQYGVKNQNLKY